MLLEKYSLAVGSAFQISRQMNIIIFTIMEKTGIICANFRKMKKDIGAKLVGASKLNLSLFQILNMFLLFNNL